MKIQSPRISHAYGRGSDADLELAAESVYAHLYYHPDFPHPPVAETHLDRAIGIFAIARAAALHGDPVAVGEKHQRREELKALLKELAAYVESRGGNDRSVLLASGFSLKSPRRPFAPAAKSPRARETAQAH